ncbi:hypothetical protein LEMLEM_LOCUS6479 [Lemmus lemmus]
MIPVSCILDQDGFNYIATRQQTFNMPVSWILSLKN